MTGLAAWEARATALLGRQPVLVGGLVLGTLVTSAVVARTRAAAQPLAIPAILYVLAVLLPAVLAHGAVSADLRSGVALLWLQKPVDPLRFYLGRGLDVIVSSVLLLVALSGAAALLATWLADAEVGRLVINGIPMLVLVGTAVAVLVFAFSAWGTSLDALLAFFVFYVTGLLLVEQGLLHDVVTWVGFPVESTANIGRYFTTGRTVDLALSVARFTLFVSCWTSIAILGLLVTTRSPLPRESAR
jgi:hypothetical protein